MAKLMKSSTPNAANGRGSVARNDSACVGASPAIRDEIIALSEEYHIITPYTSLLVLESDADRERFKVKRRFRMRDGERFFAEAVDTIDYELKQKQMRLAGNWRLGLRRALLAQLAALGRDRSVFEPRLLEERQQAQGGSGIGLALTRQIMIFHNGFIRATNREKGGASFKMTF